MLRVIVRTDNAGMACNVGEGSVEVTYKTFAVDIPELEKFLRENQSYGHRRVIGVELVEP